MMRKLAISLSLLLLAGCGDSSVAQRSSGATRPLPAQSAAAAAPEECAVEASFASVPVAVDALFQAARMSETGDYLRAEAWLVARGDAALEPLATVLLDEGADPADRLAACRTLRQLGPKAKSSLKRTLGSSSEQVRLNAIKALGLIRPTDAEILQTLSELMQSGTERMRCEAILAVGNIGPPAKASCAGLLLDLWNDTGESERVRDAARKALDHVSPRRTLLDR